MSEQGRRQAFALTVVVIGAVFVALVALGGGDSEERATTSTSESAEAEAPPASEAAAGQEPVVLGAKEGDERRERAEQRERPEPKREENRRPRAATEAEVSDAEDLQPGERPPDDVDAMLRAAKARARAFMRPYLRYEAEGASPAVRRELEPLASERLVARILSADPRTPDGVREPADRRLVGVEGELTGADRAVVVATIAYGRERSGLPLELELEESGWLVTALG